MTISLQDRRNELQKAVKALTVYVGDHWARARGVDLEDPPPEFSSLRATTWEQLHAAGLVEELGFRWYVLSGKGWLAGLDLLNKRQDDKFLRQLGGISGALKDLAKGRQRTELASPQDIAEVANVPVGLVMNVIDSSILRQWFNRIDAGWHGDEQGSLIEIPLRFGHPVL